VTAIAGLPRSGGGRGASRALGRAVGSASLALAISCIFPAPAAAQWGGSFSLESDYRLRGYSLTSGDPAATAQLTYDHPSGVYLNLAGVARFGGHDPQLMGLIGNIGYARRLNARVTLDGGVIRSQIRAAGRYQRAYRYTEYYAGASVGRVVGRLYYSPDYRGDGASTLYGELESGFEPAPEWRVSGHAGLLTYLETTPYTSSAAHFDWRIGVSRQLGRIELHGAVSDGGPGTHYYSYREHPRPVVTAGASVSF
jgi:uncharacterized protein (TIGR02001 family)